MSPRVLIPPPLARLSAWLRRETWALPLDLFRVVVGVLSFSYFIRLFLETSDFSSPDGLLDHAFISQVLWFTRWSLFQPGLPEWAFYLAYGIALIGSVALIVGERVKVWAAVLFLIAASQSRWNFVVFSIDDGVIQLCLFWLLPLPVGHTLILRDWWRENTGVLRRWAAISVPGTTLRLLLGNICLIYLTAGLSKLGSDYWREGFALYAILRQPIAWAPDLWSPAALPFLRPLTYAALLTELALPFLLTRRPGSPAKWIGLGLMTGFHLGIAATLRVPLANLALLGTAVLFFAPEIMRFVHRHLHVPQLAGDLCLRPLRWLEWSGVALLTLLALAMLRGLPLVGGIHRPAFALLWLAGQAQDYQLFGWIDGINYHMENRVQLETREGQLQEIAAERVLPRTMRHVLLQASTHRVRWMIFPSDQRSELRRRLLARLAVRTCAREPWLGRVTVTTHITRITPDDPALARTLTPRTVQFTCPDGRTVAAPGKSVAQPRRSVSHQEVHHV